MNGTQSFAPLEREYNNSHAAFHSLVIHRIYHEDNLFAQRTYALLAIHAFLIAAFSVLLTRDWRELMPFLLAIPVFGALLAFFQALYGRQTNRAIAFWRTYVTLIEKEWRIPFDTLQETFYRDASVPTPFGNIAKARSYQRPRDEVFPRWLRWGLAPFTSITFTMSSVFSPLLMLFWGGASSFVLCTLGHLLWAGAAAVSASVMVLIIGYHAIVLAKPKAYQRKKD